jgi:hypothetical protein
MRVPWDELQQVLVRSLNTLDAVRQFRIARRDTQLLASFETIDALVDYLAGEGGGRQEQDAKDQIYAALVRAVQAGTTWAVHANTVLLVGLWQGLNAIYLRQRRFYRSSADLADEIAYCFCALVGRLNLDRVHRVAATLVRSTERDVVRERRRLRQLSSITVMLEDGSSGAASGEPQLHEESEDVAGIEGRSAAQAPWFEVELRRMYARREQLLGPHAELAFAVVVLGETPHELAEREGISPEVARKRWQRVRKIVRQYFIHYGQASRSRYDR